MTEPWPAPMGDEENSRAERSLEVGEELVEALDRRGKSLLRGRDALGGTLHASLELHRGLKSGTESCCHHTTVFNYAHCCLCRFLMCALGHLA